MKRARRLVAGVAVGLAWIALGGCQNADKDKEGAPAPAEKQVETAKPAEHTGHEPPAGQKPKDHPAH